MTQQPILTRRSKILTALILSTLVLSALWQRQSADAQVSQVTGSAYGFFTSVSLFGGPANDIGPVPTVSLPAEGSASPVTASDTDGESAVYGPAVIVETDTMTVSTEGTTGDGGSVTSSSSVVFPQPQEDQVDPFNADTIESTCTADASGTSGTVTLTNASLVTKTDPEEGDPVDTIDIPANPEANATFGGTIDNVGDSFRIVFNERIEEDGVLTINAVHLYLGQNAAGEPTEGVALGEAIIGQVVCGVSASGSGGEAPATTTTSGGAQTTTTAAPSSGPASTTPAQPRFTG